MAGEGSTRVPVKIAGVVVGTATVYSDGRIVADLYEAGELGRQIYELIWFDMAKDVSIVPNTIPAAQSDPQ